MMTNYRLVSQNIHSCRLRAFALPCLTACVAQFFLGCLRKWPPESFRLARLESLCCSILPWMSEEGSCILS
ncbi:hypothetical protein ZIOFF_017939 [Zingiber officinale]|uniref:Uncharacterized protein n=1 Tax=Zingiber officinale TaxID=94328 RepID=A0A8J5HPL2_ZINOF|nr:hypothetical protein ZIOFF_017939 [Zingiber officinale]